MVRTRRAYTLIEIIVASGIFAVVVAYAIGTSFYSRHAADRTDKVDDYRQMRIVFNRVARDLQDSTRVKLPAYDFHSPRLRFSDTRDREIVYTLADQAGGEVTAEPPVDDEKVYHVVRTLGAGADAQIESIPQTERIQWMKFTRLGERLIGLTVRMRPREKGKPGAVFTATMTLNRVML